MGQTEIIRDVIRAENTTVYIYILTSDYNTVSSVKLSRIKYILFIYPNLTNHNFAFRGFTISTAKQYLLSLDPRFRFIVPLIPTLSLKVYRK